MIISILLSIYVTICCVAFFLGCKEGWENWHKRYNDGRLTSTIMNGLCYAIFWPFIVIIIIIVLYDDRRNGRWFP